MFQSYDLNAPDKMLSHWQTAVNIISEVVNVPAALIMRIHNDRIEVFTSSQSAGNPYHHNEMGTLGSGLYCEAVVKDQRALFVQNALKDADWNHNPDIERGMISYFGLPLCWPDGKPFGTICMLDNKENDFSTRYQKLLTHFQESIEGDLNTLYQQRKIAEENRSLEEQIKESAAEHVHLNTLLTHEIDRRNEIERTLVDSQFFFKESQRAAHIGSYRSNFIADTWETSEVCDQIFGIDNNYNKCVKGWSELLHPDDLDLMTQYVTEEVIGKNRTFNKEYRIVRRTDGETRWVQGLGETISDKNGTCIGLIGTIQDITIRKEAELKLISEQAFLNTLIDTLPDLIWLKNTDGVFLRCNNRFEDFFGAPRSEIVGKTDYDFVDAELANFFRKHDHMAMNKGGPSVNEEEVPFASDGHHEFLETTKVPMRDNNGDIIGVLGIGHNITRRKKASEQLKLAANVFTHAHEGIVITDPAGNIVEVNKTFTDITGYSREEVLGQNPRIFQSGRQTPHFYESMWSDLLEHKHWSGELWNRRKNGKVFAEIVTISAITDSSGKVINYISLFTDITSIKEHQQQLERIAHYDVLTNLPNRALLADRIQQAIIKSDRDKQSIAVAYLDLDNFKAINDTHGHQVGDELLVIVSQRMKEALRKGDTLARIGGDEFIAVLADISGDASYEPVLNRLQQATTVPVIIENLKLQTSASIGVTLYPQDNSNADLLIRHADQAMYIAKQSGKGHYHLFDINQDAAVKIQRESLKDIQQAIERQQFILYYQPKVNMKTGKVIGTEALIRWQHPERGLVPPGEFLPIVENNPMSVTIGEWVIDTALAQISKWKSAGFDIPVSVNVGANQLQQKDFVEKLTQALARFPEISPHYLELEILETSALEDITKISATMNACHKIGVKFSLDDFGTGYSSLTYLRRLPAEILKIDQSFIRDMLEDPDDQAIVQGVISLSSAFNLQVIAEGVETIPHGTQLLAMGCELAQGYGIARPMPASKIATWIKQWKPDPAWQQ